MACYVLAHVTIHDPEAYKEYTSQVPETVAAHGGRFLVRAGRNTVMEGEMPGERHVVIAFPDRKSAEGWYNSPEYQAILPIRQANSRGTLMIIDGHED